MYLYKKIITVIIGSFLLSIGINFFLTPFHLLDGGMIGLGLIVSYLTGLKTGFIIIILSIPIFLMAWFFNRGYFYNSLHGMLFSSFLIDIVYPFHDPIVARLDLSPFVSSVLGGIFIGLGMGMMLRLHTSTGGTDLIAQLIVRVLNINVGILIFIIDACIIGIGGLLISFEIFIFSTITITLVGVISSLFTWNVEH
ncbi:YitT family protein [Oceanobacillus halotolerans]|uniref:YitT family protein n=1 Tax=Oceanobacillus halotolerans TaxID=2663380 RepID=UPI0013DA37B2|nr:YitT family protein [Oceanobacillus halotolerans]